MAQKWLDDFIKNISSIAQKHSATTKTTRPRPSQTSRTTRKTPSSSQGFKRSPEESSTPKSKPYRSRPSQASQTRRTSPESSQDFDFSCDLSPDDSPESTGKPGRWIAPGKSIFIHGYTISQGMVYLGNHLPSPHANEPSLIDPSLPIKIASNRRPDEPLHYFPSYSDIDQEARTIYLSWLADGRREPQIDIGYVFLFFYGLERRVLIDIHRDPELKHEIPAIVADVKRLCSIYQANHSFYNYVTSFLTFMSNTSGKAGGLIV